MKFTGKYVSLIIITDNEFQRIGRDEVNVINACTGTKLEVGKDGEVSKNLDFTAEQAMAALGIPEEEQQELRQML